MYVNPNLQDLRRQHRHPRARKHRNKILTIADFAPIIQEVHPLIHHLQVTQEATIPHPAIAETVILRPAIAETAIPRPVVAEAAILRPAILLQVAVLLRAAVLLQVVVQVDQEVVVEVQDANSS